MQSAQRGENALIIFIKNPRPGKVKTRLAKDIGEPQALNVYIKLLDITRTVAQHTNASKFLFYDQHINQEDEWSDKNFIKRKQSAGDLGDRMTKAFATVLQDHRKAIIIGSDCPGISSSIIDDAFNALDHHDIVIGPTFDGGYYLLGMKKLHDFLFVDMQWSTDTVFNETMSRVLSLNLTYHMMDKLSDLDNINDLKTSGL